MPSLSISFTLGKASVPHQANIPHTNREFIARNIDQTRTHQNVTYVRQDVEDAYQQLFGDAVKEYNEKQKRADRRIENYYQHIADGKREEAFYEAIVQFGDSKTAPCGSKTGEEAQKMLDEYVRSFQQRNPNLYLFNAVLHMDEASPHLHLHFIPFYTKGRKNGLRTGVSMKAALDEQGFTATNFKNNRLVAWEENERAYMETILHAHGFQRDDKQAKYAHLTVEDYKREQDAKKAVAAIRAAQNISSADLTRSHVQQLHGKLAQLEQEKRKLEAQIHSPYKAFYYSDPDKEGFVRSKLDMMDIPYRETENGIEAQECFVSAIRKIEKQYQAPRTGHREKLRQDIDLLLMQSNSFDDLLEKLRQAGYQTKTGKYIAVRPKQGTSFLRLRSLGAQYSEFALKNRIQSKRRFEKEISEKIAAETKRDAPRAIVLQTIRFYTVTFAGGALPMRKRDRDKPFSWTNDAELDKLLMLNKKINEGATLSSLQNELAQQEAIVPELEAAVKTSEAALRSFYELKEQIEVVFEGKTSKVYTLAQAQEALKKYPAITKQNYRNVDTLIQNETDALQKAKDDLHEMDARMKETGSLVSAMEKLMGGTYVQSLVAEERMRREARFVPNGLRPAEG